MQSATLQLRSVQQAVAQSIAALVHHGGIGSSAQALAAGVPQLVMPMAYDQLDNATRLKRLKVGDWLMPRTFHSPTKVSKPPGLCCFSSPVPTSNAEELARTLRSGSNALEAACEQLERLAGSVTEF